jgi:hypothetical protein
MGGGPALPGVLVSMEGEEIREEGGRRDQAGWWPGGGTMGARDDRGVIFSLRR